MIGKDVRPKKWKNVIDLYDNGEYSAIWGNYNKSKKRVLGVRWNIGDNHKLGYPNMAGYPVWYVEPTLLAPTIIKELQLVLKNSNLTIKTKNEYEKNIEIALSELK